MRDPIQLPLLQERGGFPRSYLAATDVISYQWRKAYIKTFLEKDIPDLGIDLNPGQLRRFWTMLAHYHGQIFNASEIGTSLGITYKTSQNYLNILHSTFMVRRLPAWVANIKKRQVKAPKIYFRDPGIFHALLGIQDPTMLSAHPKLGASWKGFALEQVIQNLDVDSESCFYWGTHQGAEIDLVVLNDGRLKGYEFKFTSKPSLSKSIFIALEDLGLESVSIVTPGSDIYPLHSQVTVMGLGAQWPGH